jgi:NADH dehydrogenase
VDRRNFHLFQPLLYQVATASLSPADIASPIRTILRRQQNVQVWMGEVVDVDPDRRTVRLEDGVEAHYDYLVLATGATHAYFGHDEWARHAPGLKTLDDAFVIRRRVLSAFEHAEGAASAAEREAWLTFAVVGAGPTGVELAGTLAEIARHTLVRDFRHIDPRKARVLLVEAGPRVLSTFTEGLSEKARAQLARLGVEVRTGVAVTDLGDGFVVDSFPVVNIEKCKMRRHGSPH